MRTVAFVFVSNRCEVSGFGLRSGAGGSVSSGGILEGGDAKASALSVRNTDGSHQGVGVLAGWNRWQHRLWKAGVRAPRG